jgi:hypothetical protein
VPIVQYKCADCAAMSPPTESQYSMLTMAGWRQAPPELAERPNEWRCPTCWAAYKRRVRAQTQRFIPRLDDLLPSSKRR